jgi:hypothetical protein
MITPAGKECPHFFGDYHRGKNIEACRLLESAGIDWEPSLCEKCPAPEILQANACEFQKLSPTLERPLFFMSPQIQIEAYCSKCECKVGEPQIGCGQCHPLPEIFISES